MHTYRIVILAVAAVSAALAQSNSARILGRVLDSSGASIPNAQVTAKNTATNFSRGANTQSDGSYQIQSLPLGAYEIRVAMAAFKTEVRTGVVLAVGESARLDFVLTPGQVNESVSVTAEAPLVNTTTPELGAVIDPKRVEDLPINGRNFTNLVNLQPGVQTRSFRGKTFSFNGLTQVGMSITLDGTDASFIESPGFGEMSGNSLLNAVSMESISELKVQTGTFTAEVGRASSGGINVITRSGGNDFHGALFHFIRNDKMDARTFFAAQRDPLRQNQFGGSIGGPISRNKLFFFGSYEGARRRIGRQISGVVPTQSFRDRSPGIFKPLLDRVPLPTEPVDADTGIHRRSSSFVDDENLGNAKIDHHTSKLQSFFRYSINKSRNSTPSILPVNSQVFEGTNHLLTFSNTAIISSLALNEFRAGFNRWLLPRKNTSFDGGLGWLQINGVLTGQLEGKLQWTDNSYTLADNFSYRAGRHSMKAGFESRRVQASRIQKENTRYNYNSAADFFANRVDNVRLIFGTAGIGLRHSNFGFFAQDDIQATPRLVLNVGLRYEYNTPYTEVAGRLYNVLSDPYGAYRPKGEAIYNRDRNNFNPRFGFAYDLTGKQRTVVRGGFGLYTSPLPPFFIMDQPTVDPRVPFGFDARIQDIPGLAFPITTQLQAALNDPLQAIQQGFLPSVLGRRVVDPNLRDTYSVQWNLSLQQQFGSHWAAQSTYVGNSNVKVNISRKLNLVNPATRLRDVRTIGEIDSIENSGRRNYHALQLSLKKRESRGFSADFFYTYSHTLSYFGEDSSVQDWNNIAGSRGNASSDVRHALTFNYSYKLPLARLARGTTGQRILDGWGVQGITRLSTGSPLNITTARDIRGDGSTNQRPNYAGGSQYAAEKTILQWFNRSAFVLPAAGTFGNLGAYTVQGPGSIDVDLSVIKRMRIRESHELQFRAEFFGLPNRANFGNPVTAITSSTFGRITTASGNRQVQLGLRYEF